MGERKSRSEQTQATRDRILDHAKALFRTNGYVGTSTRRIAEAAGVTERTLFNVFTSKSELLRQAVVRTVTGDLDRPLMRRDDFQSFLTADDGEAVLERFVSAVTDVHLRAAVLAEVVRAAAASDAGVAEFWKWGMRQEVQECQRVVRTLVKGGWLRPDISVIEAAGSLSVLSGHDAYWRLTVDCGWSQPRYRRWLLRTCRSELLGLK